MFTYQALKEYLFRLDPESAHNLAESAIRLSRLCTPCQNYFIEKNFVLDERLNQIVFDKKFLNPVGLAAGFDKNATMIRQSAMFGFGYTEVGTITPKAQDGNAKPRVFRFVEEESLQNAFGFNNQGMQAVKKRLERSYPFVLPVGVNIGKNKLTADKTAINDYRVLIETLEAYADYMVINISSPNTKGLRTLQNEEFIKDLFEMSKELTNKPILLKIAPDLEKKEALSLCIKAVEHGAKGIIATNTTIDYSLLQDAKNFGGISGKVLADKSFEIFDYIAAELYGQTTLISVGGIDSAEEAYRRIKAGATLVQLYTSFIFKGPSIAKHVNEGIMELMNFDGFAHISEAIGADRKPRR
jgi:dihydroorotate dehydrogenase